MKKISIFSHHVLLLFCFLGIIFIPFSFNSITFQQKITQWIFEDLIVNTSAVLKNVTIVNKEISSDSTTLYILFLLLFFIAFFSIFVLHFFHFYKKTKTVFTAIARLILTYYLAMILLKYGFDKIFKSQFYLPEPNTLFTPLGMLDKDILFWSTMGSSYSYNIFLGLLEVITALMLLFRKTRVLGLLIALGVMINIVAINFCFDISVKLFSSFLFLIALLLMIPYARKIFHFFISNTTTAISYVKQERLVKSKLLYFSLKTMIMLFFFSEAVMPYMNTQQFNDDEVPRNYLHGAYGIIEDANTLNNSNTRNLKRIFIHRYNYIIFQYKDDSMEDYYLTIDKSLNLFKLTDYNQEQVFLNYTFSKEKNILKLTSDSLNFMITAKVIPWKKLPLLQKNFHWSVDEI